MNEIALELAHREYFTVPEWLEREKCIMAIRVFDKQRLLAEQALTQIRDKKLYRPYSTLKEFCQRTFGWSDRRTQQVLAAEKVVASLPDEMRTKVRTERQARELSKHPEEQRPEILDEAVRFHAKNGETPTPKEIKAAADQIGKATDKDGVVIPEGDASYHWRHRSQGDEVLAKIQAAGAAVKELNQDDVMWIECELQQTIRALRSAYHLFKGGLPTYVCPKCKGKKPKDCTFCHGRGMIGTWKRKKNAGGKEFLDELSIRGQ